MLRLEIAIIVLWRVNSCTTQPVASSTSRIVRSGEYSSHSPGWFGRPKFSFLSRETSMPMSSAVTAVFGPGADQMAMATEITSRTSVTSIDCHKKIVSENGMTPVIDSNPFGRLAGFACNCAADEDSPIAQVAPSPR